jgi:LPS-assembly lipoprotein
MTGTMRGRRGFVVSGLGLAVSLGSGLGLSGCGFALRRAPQLNFRTVQLVGFKAHSPLADALRLHINASESTRVVDSPTPAEVLLEALADVRDKGVVASTATGQVREIQVRASLSFRLRTPGGKLLIAPTDIALSRDMSYSESLALAKEQEEALLHRAMQDDIVAQVMRRLAAVPAL